jgi:hypothetical protein
MPTPNTPPFADEILATLANIEAAVLANAAAIAAQAEDLDRIANFQRLMYESMYGADVNSAGIWDGSDRYPDV